MQAFTLTNALSVYVDRVHVQAGLLGDAGAFGDAGDEYAKLGSELKAFECFEAAKRWRDAARM